MTEPAAKTTQLPLTAVVPGQTDYEPVFLPLGETQAPHFTQRLGPHGE